MGWLAQCPRKRLDGAMAEVTALSSQRNPVATTPALAAGAGGNPPDPGTDPYRVSRHMAYPMRFPPPEIWSTRFCLESISWMMESVE